MEAHIFSTTDTSSSQSQQTSSNHSSDIRCTKTKFTKQMKKLLFCAHLQDQSTSPPYQSTSSTKSRANSKTKMAANTTHHDQWYTVVCGGHHFTLPVRYQDPVSVGNGAFGTVIRATDTETGKYVAIKKMLHPFQTATHARRTYRELKLLMYLNHPDANVIQLYNVFTPEKSVNDFQTLYFVFNFVESDLDKIIKRNFPFEEDLIRKIIYALLRGLKFMHSAGIIHRDLKPANIGVDKNSDVTILDFGLARVASTGVQTGYVSTRWWRAPEIYINWEQYNDKLDIWSVGCIMAELITLRAVFRGKDHIDQLNKIFDILGTPDLATLKEICTTDTCAYISRLPPKPKQDYMKVFGFTYGAGTTTPISGVSPQGVDLLDRLLSFDHRVRPSAEEALAHPFFENSHDLMEEPTAERMVDEHADANYTIQQWKAIIWEMIEEFLPPSWVTNAHVDDS